MTRSFSCFGLGVSFGIFSWIGAGSVRRSGAGVGVACSFLAFFFGASVGAGFSAVVGLAGVSFFLGGAGVVVGVGFGVAFSVVVGLGVVVVVVTGFAVVGFGVVVVVGGFGVVLVVVTGFLVVVVVVVVVGFGVVVVVVVVVVGAASGFLTVPDSTAGS